MYCVIYALISSIRYGKKTFFLIQEKHQAIFSDEVEGGVQKLFPDAEILIHQDPEGILEEQKTFE